MARYVINIHLKNFFTFLQSNLIFFNTKPCHTASPMIGAVKMPSRLGHGCLCRLAKEK